VDITSGIHCITTPGTYSINLNGGTLVVCGTGEFFLNGSYNSGAIYINSGATVTLGYPNINLPVYNRGVFNINSNVMINDNGSILVVGAVNISGNLTINGGLTNLGRVNVAGELTLNAQAEVCLGKCSAFTAQRIAHANAQFKGDGGCLHVIQPVGWMSCVANFGVLTPADHSITLCAENGFSTSQFTIINETGTSGGAHLKSHCAGCRFDFAVQIESNKDNTCPKEPVVLTARVTSQATEAAASYSYAWSPTGKTTAAITVNPAVTTAYTVNVTDNAGCFQAQNTFTVTLNPNCKPPRICEGRAFINISSPTCGSNGQLSIGQVNIVGEETIPCSAVWTEVNTQRTSTGNLFAGISAGTYLVEINCGEINCSDEIVVEESQGNGDDNSGLLGKYYAATTEDCKFLAKNLVLQRTDANIDFDWSQKEDPALAGVSSIRWTGFVTPPVTGTYFFYKTPDTGGVLYVNEQLVTGNGIALEAETAYPVIYDLANYPENTPVKIEWTIPGSSEKELIRPCLLQPSNLGDGDGDGNEDECNCGKGIPDIEILPAVVDICDGEQSVRLKAKAYGALLWSPTNETTPSILAKPGYYSVKATNRCGQSKEQEVQVRSLEELKISASITGGEDRICGGDPIGLSAAGGEYYKWDPAAFLSNPNIANPQATPVTTTTFTVEITTEGGCKVNRSVDVTVEPMFELQVSVLPDAEGCDGDTVTIEVSGADSYTWDPENDLIFCPQCASPKHVINGDKTFTVSGKKGICTAEAEVNIYSKLSSGSAFGFDVQKTPGNGCLLTFAAKDFKGFDQFAWDFGDKNTETKTTPNVSHPYDIHGKYNVCLTVYSSQCGQSRKICEMITIDPEECNNCMPQCND
jgi:hypothetical protein